MLTTLVRSVLPALPTAVGFRLTRLLAGVPPSLSLKERDREALASGERIEFGRRTRKVAWSWGEGPLVVLVHGWGARVTQVATLARHLAEAGCEAVAFDVTAHGESEGWRVSFRDFIADVAEMAEAVDRSVHACVGHSAGGLGMMAARRARGLRAERYVCLCAPLYPYVPIRAIRRRLNAPEAVLDRCREHYGRQFGASWEELKSGSAFAPSDGAELLLVYDESDEVVDHRDGDRIRELWPSASLLKTEGLGHREVLWTPEVMDEVARFVVR